MDYVVSEMTEEEFFSLEHALKEENLVVRPAEYSNTTIAEARHYYFKAAEVSSGKILGTSAFCVMRDAFRTEFYHRGSWTDKSARKLGIWAAIFEAKIKYIVAANLAKSTVNFHTVSVAVGDTRYKGWATLKNTIQESPSGRIERVWHYIRHEELIKMYGLTQQKVEYPITTAVPPQISTQNFQYTASNHFKFGYNGIPFLERASDTDKWFVKYGKLSRPPGTLREEARAAAAHIRAVNRGDIEIFFSGGAGSEIVLRAFVEAGVRVNCHIMRYDKYINAHDWSAAAVICNQLGVTPIYHDLDLINFYESGEYKKYSDFASCVSPQLLPQLWLMTQVQGVPVLGSQCYTARTDIAEKRQTDFSTTEYAKTTRWVLCEKEKLAAWYRFPMKLNRAAVPSFFQYTPELMYAFLKHPASRHLHTNNRIGKLSNKSVKFEIYRDNYPNIIGRPVYSGFECVELYDVHLRKQLQEAHPHHEYEYWSDVEQLLSYMEGNSQFPENLSPPFTDPGFKLEG